MAANQTVENILKRSSCRYFLPDPIEIETISTLIETLRWAPSAGNIQPWFFYIVESKRIKALLAGAAYGQNFILNAPVVFVICSEPGKSAKHYGNRGETLYSIQDTAAAIENLMIAATSLGLGSCWVGAFDEPEVIKCLAIPENLKPVGIIPVGKIAGFDPKPGRKPVEKITKWIKD